MDLTVEVICTINPTEEKENVLKAMRNIFPYNGNSEIEDELAIISGEQDLLINLKDLIEEMDLELIARKLIQYNKTDNVASFRLNKQAAFVDTLNFVPTATRSDLGEIEVFVYFNEDSSLNDGNVFESFLEWFAFVECSDNFQ
ncbi:MAG: RNA-binding domain-containing protein [Methanobacteriaceae archaeon]